LRVVTGITKFTTAVDTGVGIKVNGLFKLDLKAPDVAEAVLVELEVERFGHHLLQRERCILSWLARFLHWK